jgi:glycosyltransferase involved in cell wall biosynthesis
MQAFHICRTASTSGIARYAIDFHNLVLEPLGYQLITPGDVTTAWIESLPNDTLFHVQLGVLQFEERQALTRLLRSGRTLVDATLHDPPFLTFPYFPFRSPLMMRLSRGFDWYLGSLGVQTRTLHRLRKAYVLSERGRQSLAAKGARNVEHIPHVVAPQAVWAAPTTQSQDILYFGFIGPAKGIEYALQLHERIVESQPHVRLHVAGDAIGASEKAFLAGLKGRYVRQVIYHGYVDESKLDALFAQVRHVFLPFEPYRYFNPASGSVINALKRGRVVWSTPVNSVPELIQHRVNGLHLSKDLDQDSHLFLQLSEDTATLDRLAGAALETARAMSTYPYAHHFEPAIRS